jgi:hypothetical protein
MSALFSVVDDGQPDGVRAPDESVEVTLRGRLRSSWHPHYKGGTSCFIETSGGKVCIAITAPGGGWARIYLSKEEVLDLAVSLEEEFHRVPRYVGEDV